MGRLALALPIAVAMLVPTQLDNPYEYGYNVVDHIIKGEVTPDDDSDNDTCPNCGGTGKVGDGRVSVTCQDCGGDGRLDDGRDNQRKEGDQISNLPGGLSSGRSSYTTPRRMGPVRSFLRRIVK